MEALGNLKRMPRVLESPALFTGQSLSAHSMLRISSGDVAAEPGVSTLLVIEHLDVFRNSRIPK